MGLACQTKEVARARLQIKDEAIEKYAWGRTR